MACPVPIAPKKVLILKGVRPPELELREPPTVRVAARFVDSRGRPVREIPVMLSGQLSSDPEMPEPSGEIGVPMETYGTWVNEAVTADFSTRLDWVGRALPDANGEVVLQVPKGLRAVTLTTLSRDENRVIKTRMSNGEGLLLETVLNLGTLEGPRTGISFVIYDCPKVLLMIREEEGKLPANVGIYGMLVGRENQTFAAFEAIGDGRYRARGVFPDEDYVFFAQAEGHAMARTRKARLAEGSSSEFSITLLKSDPPVAVGDMAPPILVRTLDGRDLSMADFRRKFVLLSFWSSLGGMDADLVRMKGLRDRYGADERFAMLGLIGDYNVDNLSKLIKDRGLDWPQALLGPQSERLQAAFGDARMPHAVLIGPDGRVVATGLQGDAVDKAVAGALGAR